MADVFVKYPPLGPGARRVLVSLPKSTADEIDRLSAPGSRDAFMRILIREALDRWEHEHGA